MSELLTKGKCPKCGTDLDKIQARREAQKIVMRKRRAKEKAQKKRTAASLKRAAKKRAKK